MKREIILCIPGPWFDRGTFLRAIQPAGEFLFAGRILTHSLGKDDLPVDFTPPYTEMREAFRIAGQGRMTAETLDLIHRHAGVIYLHFPADILEQRERLLKFTEVVQRAGGFAIKLETSGVAHEWDSWFSLLSGSTFDLYSGTVTLIADTDRYYSCGMHQFGLPECSLPRPMDAEDATDFMNQFNMHQLVERPQLATGQTFSLSPESPTFRLNLSLDSRHDRGDLFHNPHGVWELYATQ